MWFLCLFGWGALVGGGWLMVDGRWVLFHWWFPIRGTHPNPAEQQGVHFATVLCHRNCGYHRYGRLLLSTQIDRHGFNMCTPIGSLEPQYYWATVMVICGYYYFTTIIIIVIIHGVCSVVVLAERLTEAAAKFHEWSELLINLLIATDSSASKKCKWIKAQVEYSTINWHWRVPMATISWPNSQKLPTTITENWLGRKKKYVLMPNFWVAAKVGKFQQTKLVDKVSVDEESITFIHLSL